MEVSLIIISFEIMNKETHAFYHRLNKQAEALEKNGLPIELSQLISATDLKDIYAYLLDDKCKADISDDLAARKPYELKKEETGLARTLNIVSDPISNDIQLILETKSKAVNQLGITEKISIPIQRAKNKVTKPAWRIDTAKPEKMANTVFYDLGLADDPDTQLDSAYKAASITKELVKKIGAHAAKYIHVVAPGIVKEKKASEQNRENSQGQSYVAKQSYYSTYALNNLENFIKNLNQYNAVTEQLYQKITHDLLTGISYLHQANVIHQNIKPASILVFDDENGDYNFAISNFYNFCYPSKDTVDYPLATYEYASPEIFALYANSNKLAEGAVYLHDCFHQKANFSYGKKIYEEINPLALPSDSYQTSHPANDAWAIGMTLHELYHSRKPNSDSDFSHSSLITGLLDPNRETRLTAEDALTLFDHMPPPSTPRYSLKDKIEEFFTRIEDKSDFPIELENLITKPQLNAIYDYLKNPEHQLFFTKHLLSGMPYRLDKFDTGLARTLNLVFDPIRHDVQLILETKSKVINKKGITQKTNVPVFTGMAKSIKPAWRIDTPTPIKMANAVFYVRHDDDIDYLLENERLAAALATLTVRLGGAHAEKYINVTAVGAEIRKYGQRIDTPDGATQEYYAKQSYYSEYAIGDLDHILSNPIKYPLNAPLHNNMTHDLLLGLKYIQVASVIHQDIKTKNILVYPDEKSGFNLKIADFGNAYHPTLLSEVAALASFSYESPEISAAYSQAEKPSCYNYDYFHGDDCYSYGKKIYKIMASKISVAQLNTYDTPHNANDMWALGIVLHELHNKNKQPILNKVDIQNKYLSGLIDSDRETRLTIDKALALFYESHPKFKTDNQFELETPAQSFLPKFNQKNNDRALVDIAKDLVSFTTSKIKVSLF